MQNFPRAICHLLFVFCFLLLGSVFASEANAQAETHSFFIESTYDLFGRKEVAAKLVREDRQLYFYVEKSWWDSRSVQEQNDLRIAMAELGLEFQNHIYPVLTAMFGSEPRPGIDRDERITVLVHQMASEAGGYFRSGDVYERAISPSSNEREMVYLNSMHIASPQAKSFLAHEFIHLITANQKDLLRRVSEETWLNEARAEYVPTLLGYDDVYRGSNLERRVRDFLVRPSSPLTEWFNQVSDYGVVNLFAQYLVDHYGVKILVDSLQSSQVGVSSLGEALRVNDFEEGFAQVFENWLITLLVNDCQLGERYCYKNPHLKDLRITPTSYFIPRAETIFATYHTTIPWSANWHRLVGGAHNFTLAFEGTNSAGFRVPYVLCEANNTCSVGLLVLDETHRGKITLSDFGEKYNSLALIPFIAGNNGEESSSAFSWQVTTREEPTAQDEELISQLLDRIAQLQEQVRKLQVQLAAARGQESVAAVSCARFEENLSFGARGQEVQCLQEFLRAQGPDVYPEGLITGNFLSLTRQAVIRFQEKYAPEILTPLGLGGGTGYVGQMTRSKINQLLEFSTAMGG